MTFAKSLWASVQGDPIFMRRVNKRAHDSDPSERRGVAEFSARSLATVGRAQPLRVTRLQSSSWGSESGLPLRRQHSVPSGPGRWLLLARLGVHHVSDVVAGLFFGAAAARAMLSRSH